MSRKSENSVFVCINCGKKVEPLTNGSYRNHCPHCLYSKHADNGIGDRQSGCNGLMKPIGVRYNSKKGYQLIHVCITCGCVRVNKIAENTVMPDNLDMILTLMNTAI